MKACRSSCKAPVILVILMTLEFSRYIFKKNSQMSDFVKIHTEGSEFLHADRGTVRHEVTRRFSQFCECAEKCHVSKQLMF